MDKGLKLTETARPSWLFDADVIETSVAMNIEHVVAVGRGWTSIVC